MFGGSVFIIFVKSQSFCPCHNSARARHLNNGFHSLFGMVHALFFKGGESKPFQTFEVKNMAKSKPFKSYLVGGFKHILFSILYGMSFFPLTRFKSYLFFKSPFRMLVAPEVSSRFRRRRIDKALGRTTA
jgi:hypothetical protein